MPENGINARVRVLESQMRDVKDGIKSIRSGQFWLMGVGWLIVIGIVTGWIIQ